MGSRRRCGGRSAPDVRDRQGLERHLVGDLDAAVRQQQARLHQPHPGRQRRVVDHAGHPAGRGTRASGSRPTPTTSRRSSRSVSPARAGSACSGATTPTTSSISPGTSTARPIPPGPPRRLGRTSIADDHMDLKADSNGKIYAVVKTSINGSGQPLIEMLVRQPGGGWSPFLVANGSDCAPVRSSSSTSRPGCSMSSRPVRRTAAAAARRPEAARAAARSREDVPDVVDLVSTSQGTPVMCDATDSSTSHDMNNASSTKQNINSSPAWSSSPRTTPPTATSTLTSRSVAAAGRRRAADFTSNATTGNAPLTCCSPTRRRTRPRAGPGTSAIRRRASTTPRRSRTRATSTAQRASTRSR